MLLCTLLSSCTVKKISDTPIVRTGFFFDTFIQISLYGTDDETILDECMALSSHYEDLLSRTKEGSDIWKINHAEGNPVTVDADTVLLLETALSYSKKTDGLFDVTIGAVSSLWNFSQEPKGPVPDRDVIASALTHVGYENIVIDKNTVRLKDPEAMLDCGAIAKGFIADRLKDLLLERGVKSALINLGGNVLAIGEKPSGDAFHVGVQMPFSTQGETAAVVNIKDASTVTSGNYERFFEEDGVLYHHILDATTGYPSQSDLVGITVYAKQSVDADALSTICFILGSEDGLKLIEETDGAEALFITGTPGDISGYKLITSSGFPMN